MAANPHSAPASGWRTMAMIELDGAVDALGEILSDLRFDCRLNPAPPSVADNLRFYVVADASRGQQRAVRSAMVLLSALDAIAQSGEFAGFRIVAAEERLLLDAWRRRDGSRPKMRAQQAVGDCML
jgi:hypothetical protein